MKLTISHDQEHLEIAEEDYEMFKSWVTNRSHVIAWERHGLIGLISLEMMGDMLRVWDCYLDLKARGRIAEVPALIHTFTWSDTIEHTQAPSYTDRNVASPSATNHRSY
jgi:hypothetical protein